MSSSSNQSSPPAFDEGLPQQVRSVQDLVSWMTLRNKEDKWWFCLDGVTEENPVTASEIRALLNSGERFGAKVWHVSAAEQEAWTEIALSPSETPQAPLPNRPISYGISVPLKRASEEELSLGSTSNHNWRAFFIGCSALALLLGGLAFKAHRTSAKRQELIVQLEGELSANKTSNKEGLDYSEGLNEVIAKLHGHNNKLRDQISKVLDASEKSQEGMSKAYSGLVAEYNALNSKYLELIDENRGLASRRDQERLREQRAAAVDRQRVSQERQALLQEQRRIAAVQAEIAELEMLRELGQFMRQIQPIGPAPLEIDLRPDPATSYDVDRLTNQIGDLEREIELLRISR